MDLSSPLISVVVPVYNVEPYLRRCVDSILAQTYTNVEVILIDDGSLDGCPAICDEYSEKDSRIVVIHQKNKGVSAARNAGLDVAKGKYIGFVDSDDWIEPEMYESMVITAEHNNCDIVICGVKYFEEGNIEKEASLLSSGEYDRKQLLEEIFGMPNRVGGGCCNKVFCTEVVKDIRFNNELVIAEDRYFLFCAFEKCEYVIKIDLPLYCVLERKGSATRNKNTSSFINGFLSSSSLLLLCKKKEPWLEGKATVKYLDDCVRYIPELRAAGKETHRPYRMSIVRIKYRMAYILHKSWFRKLISSRILVQYFYLCLKS